MAVTCAVVHPDVRRASCDSGASQDAPAAAGNGLHLVARAHELCRYADDSAPARSTAKSAGSDGIRLAGVRPVALFCSFVADVKILLVAQRPSQQEPTALEKLPRQQPRHAKRQFA